MSIWKFQLFIGGFSLGLMSYAISLISIRPLASDLNVQDLRRRLWALRWAIVLASALLIITVVNVKVLLDWPLSLLENKQATALRTLASSMVFDVALGSTLVIVCFFLPSTVSYYLDVLQYRASHTTLAVAEGRRTDTADDEGLSFAPVASLASGLALLAPLLTSPVIDLLKRLFGSG
jgi:hypothetical protein